MPSISGVAIDTLLFSRIGSPLCHRYRLISRTGSHAAFRCTYLRHLHAFLDESDSAVARRLHRRLAQELASRVVLPTDSPATSIDSRTPDCFSVTTTASPKRGYQFSRGAGVKLSPSGGDVFHAGIDGSRAPSVCGTGGRASSGSPAVVGGV